MTENKTLACACLGTNLGIRQIMHSHRPLALVEPTATGPTQLTSSASAILGPGACLLV